MSALKNTSLKVLNLESNDIKGEVSNLPNSLKSLNLKYNRVSKVDPTLNNLVWLNLGSNKIKDEDGLTIPDVKSLNIRWNNFTQVPDMPKSVRNLDISGNPLNYITDLPPNIEVLDIRSMTPDKVFGESECVSVDQKSPRTLKVLIHDHHQYYTAQMTRGFARTAARIQADPYSMEVEEEEADPCHYPGIDNIDFVTERTGVYDRKKTEVWEGLNAYINKRNNEEWK
jgi:hypothetical protein